MTRCSQVSRLFREESGQPRTASVELPVIRPDSDYPIPFVNARACLHTTDHGARPSQPPLRA